MNVTRMDSCGGLIISPRELIKIADIKEDFEQRGSLDGCESLLIKRG